MCQHDEDGLQAGLGSFLFSNSLGMFNAVYVTEGFADLIMLMQNLLLL